MHTFGKRLGSLAVAGALVLGGLVGCGPAEPTNAQELVERYQQTEGHDNYHADIDYDIEVSFLGQSMPISAKTAFDIVGDDAHGTMTLEGLGQDAKTEMYFTKEGDDYVQYTSAEDGAWSKSEVKNGAVASELTSEKVLADAEFQKTEDGYTLTVEGQKLMDALESMGDFSTLLSEIDDEALTNSIKDSKAVYTYDKNCMLTGVEYNLAFDYDYGAAMGGDDSSDFSLTMSMSMDLKMAISGYGTVKAEDVAVPDDVKSGAVDTGSLTDGLTDLLDEDLSDVEEGLAA